MKMQKIGLVSTLLSLIACSSSSSRPDYNIKELYTVKISTLISGENYTDPIPIGNNTKGFCHEYFPEEDLLIVQYKTPNTGTRQDAKIILESVDTFNPTLISLIAPKELKSEGMNFIKEDIDSATGSTKYSIVIPVPANAADGRIKIRFQSTVDISKIPDAENEYTLSSEYFVKNNTNVTVDGYPLREVTNSCNSVIWFDRVWNYMLNNFKDVSISLGEIKSLSLLYNSEIIRKREACLARRFGRCFVKAKKSCDSDSDLCDSEEEVKCAPVEKTPELCVASITPASIQKSVGICALFNIMEKVSFTDRNFDHLIECVLGLKVKLNLNLVSAILDNAIKSCEIADPCLSDYKTYREELDLPECSYESIIGSFGEQICDEDSETLRLLCNLDVDISVSRNKSGKACAKKVTKPTKKATKKINEDSSSSDETESKSEGSGVGKVAIAVGVVALIIVCAVGVSYLI